jgi:F420-dependent oxidoreductase-like protein
MDLAIMIEGQDGLNWARWKRIARAVEDLGFAGLYRSDHFTNPRPPDRDSLEMWVSLAWLAANTSRLEFGPLVTPFSFRHPVFTARMGKDVDDLSAGRLILGVGAGWEAREHDKFGFDLLSPGQRFDRFEEGVEVTARLLRDEGPVDFAGKFYFLRDAQLLPRPQRPGGPPLLIGGNGRRRTIPLAARWADEWNGVFSTPEEFGALNRRLTDLLVDQGRSLSEVRRSLMTNLIFGRDGPALDAKLSGRDRSAAELREGGRIVGTPDEIVDQLREYSDAGAQRIMLQWLDQDDIDGLEALAESVLPSFPTE